MAFAVMTAVCPEEEDSPAAAAAAALVEAAVDVHGADAARGTLPAALMIWEKISFYRLCQLR